MNLAESHSDVPYEQRWELLKPAIMKIYLEERVTLPRLAERMANDYGFKAEYVQFSPRILLSYTATPLSSEAFSSINWLDRVSPNNRTHQYRYRLKNWGIKKRTTTVEKEAVITALGKRRRQHDIGTSNVQLEQGGWLKPVDKKQLKRYINDSIRTERPVFIQPGL